MLIVGGLEAPKGSRATVAVSSVSSTASCDPAEPEAGAVLMNRDVAFAM